jgi:aminoglycoside phosphotransferase family enzyme/predicted kinase
MVIADQSEVIDFLSRPATHGGHEVERVETHASIVFLAGARALKLKRAVRYDYLDFSTPERRHRLCEAEVTLNRRTAPGLYDGVLAITRERDGALALAGRGTAIDWVVAMHRFDQDRLLDRLATRGELPLGLMAPLGDAVARLHQGAVRRPDFGGTAGIERVIAGNARSLKDEPAAGLSQTSVQRLFARQHETLQRQARRLEARRREGFVRHCHGDLHLRNLVLLDTGPTLFDGIEFNDDLACIDVQYDLAFLLMDLWCRRLRAHANAVWNAYVAATNDLDGLSLLPLFLSCRATIRAKTSLTAASLATDAVRRGELHERAQSYLALADTLVQPVAPCLVAIGGCSGSGKSTVARTLACDLGSAPGAVVVRSDQIRKWLCGGDRPADYSPGATQRVYAAAAERCGRVVDGGYTAIADAVFGRPAQCRAIEAFAQRQGVPFVGIWLEAPRDLLVQRVTARTGDLSDADAGVVARQVAETTPPANWLRVDAARPLDSVVGDVRAVVADALPALVSLDA